jgi:hypothetical protein
MRLAGKQHSVRSPDCPRSRDCSSSPEAAQTRPFCLQGQSQSRIFSTRAFISAIELFSCATSIIAVLITHRASIYNPAEGLKPPQRLWGFGECGIVPGISDYLSQVMDSNEHRRQRFISSRCCFPGDDKRVFRAISRLPAQVKPRTLK